MKSAYEIAMERMEQAAGPAQKLTDEQRQAIAAIDNACDAKAAETKLAFDAKIAVAPPHEKAELAEELRAELARIESKRQDEKDAVWNEAAK